MVGTDASFVFHDNDASSVPFVGAVVVVIMGSGVRGGRLSRPSRLRRELGLGRDGELGWDWWFG